VADTAPPPDDEPTEDRPPAPDPWSYYTSWATGAAAGQTERADPAPAESTQPPTVEPPPPAPPAPPAPVPPTPSPARPPHFQAARPSPLTPTLAPPPATLTPPPPPPAPPPPVRPPQAEPPPPPAAELYAPAPKAEEFARRRVAVSQPESAPATIGFRGLLRRASLGLIKPKPGRKEAEDRRLTGAVRRNFGGLRQITVVNPKGGAGKTVAALLLAMTFGQKRGGYVLAWDNNETQGTLGMRAMQDFHVRTVRDLLRDLKYFQDVHGRVGDLSQYVRSQGEAMFDVLSSDESATAGEMLTAEAFQDLREVVARFYKLIIVDTGNNVRRRTGRPRSRRPISWW
jgi:hypothetical protein